ncbi:hypothetical protein C8Q77DRAFT_1065419 [Trametes polyzona]|nr:hypothetical protein C8Q77DRAFT_1065419 [Trametes polyzona]
MTYTCLGCTESFETAVGLGQHGRRCPGRVSYAATHLRKRKADQDAEEAQKRQPTFTPELEGTPHAPSPPPRESRTGHRIRVPRRWEDFRPSIPQRELPTQIAEAFSAPASPSSSPPPRGREPLAPEEVYDTDPDVFGVYHRYKHAPTRQPAPPSTLGAMFEELEPGKHDIEPQNYPNIRWINRSIAHTVADNASPYGPFKSKATYLLCEWFYNSSNTKSLADLDALVDILRTSGFDLSDLVDFNARREMQRLDDYVNPCGVFSGEDGWREGEIELPLPQAGTTFPSEADAPRYTVDGIHYCKLLEVIISEMQDRRFAEQRHWLPYHSFWVPPTGSPSPDSPSSQDDRARIPEPPDPIRIISEMFDSNAMNEEDECLRNKPRNASDHPSIEYAILPLLLWSDTTLLAQFGSAKLWPIYLYIGNISKYVRGMPTQFVAQHITYVPELPHELHDFYCEQFHKAPTTETLRWLRSELMQQVWTTLLDDEFVHAYVHGVLVECADGVVRRLFPRFFSYSADYPEKVLLTAIKNLGKCPCTRCLVKMADIPESGTRADLLRRKDVRRDSPALRSKIKRARKWLFTHGIPVTSIHIERLINQWSLNPLQSAFSLRLGERDPNFNVYDLLAPDLMHEFELGVWKGIFLHLMRLLHAQGPDTVQEFNHRSIYPSVQYISGDTDVVIHCRMRKMPTFGRDVIRRFWHNVASQKRLAARDYEDFLIVALSAFEGLLPIQDDHTIQDMLFELANWHALASLRLHTTVTLDIWRTCTRYMYTSVRMFAWTTCERYNTRELPQESEARARVATAKASKKGASIAKERTTPPTKQRSPRFVKFTVHKTYKYHALGHHPDFVERSGTTDNHNTRTGELEHRHVKREYSRTNKRDFERQIAIHQRRQAILRSIRPGLHVRGPMGHTIHASANDRRASAKRLKGSPRARMAARAATQKTRAGIGSRAAAPDGDEYSEDLVVQPGARYSVGQSQRKAVNIYDFAAQHHRDPAVEDYISSLRRHLTARLLDTAEDNLEDNAVDYLDIENDRLYTHQVIEFDYTTYDMRRVHDSVNPRTHPDIVLLSQDPQDDYPYWHARVIAIYHARVRHTAPGSVNNDWRRVDLLWVRWFARDLSQPTGFQHRRLPRVSFIPADDPDAMPFGFVDPALVLRAAYITPSFHSGTTTDLLPSDSIARADGKKHDYWSYQISMFVDRDMYMRHLGGGVGHRGLGVSLEQSRAHALRLRRDRTEHNNNSECVSEDDDRSLGDSDDDPSAENELGSSSGMCDINHTLRRPEC